MLDYFTVNTVAELGCFIVAFICIADDKNFIWQCMALYSFITFVAEITGIFISGPAHLNSNHWVYNIFLICESLFNLLMLAHLISRYSGNKYIMLPGGIIFIIAYLWEIFTHPCCQIFSIYNNRTYAIMSVVFVLYSLYFYYLLIKDDLHVALKYSPEFWWTAGTLFFYFAVTASNIFYDNLSRIFMNGYHLTHYIFRILNVILYTSWSYSFICRRWLKTTSENLS